MDWSDFMHAAITAAATLLMPLSLLVARKLMDYLEARTGVAISDDTRRHVQWALEQAIGYVEEYARRQVGELVRPSSSQKLEMARFRFRALAGEAGAAFDDEEVADLLHGELGRERRVSAPPGAR